MFVKFSSFGSFKSISQLISQLVDQVSQRFHLVKGKCRAPENVFCFYFTLLKANQHMEPHQEYIYCQVSHLSLVEKLKGHVRRHKLITQHTQVSHLRFPLNFSHFRAIFTEGKMGISQFPTPSRAQCMY